MDGYAWAGEVMAKAWEATGLGAWRMDRLTLVPGWIGKRPACPFSTTIVCLREQHQIDDADGPGVDWLAVPTTRGALAASSETC
jgi:hypothetical protein